MKAQHLVQFGEQHPVLGFILVASMAVYMAVAIGYWLFKTLDWRTKPEE